MANNTYVTLSVWGWRLKSKSHGKAYKWAIVRAASHSCCGCYTATPLSLSLLLNCTHHVICPFRPLCLLVPHSFTLKFLFVSSPTFVLTYSSAHLGLLYERVESMWHNIPRVINKPWCSCPSILLWSLSCLYIYIPPFLPWSPSHSLLFSLSTFHLLYIFILLRLPIALPISPLQSLPPD